jgi:hypothetical protein
MRRVVPAAILATALGVVLVASTARAFTDQSAWGACMADASTTRGPGLGCDYSSCTDGGMPRGFKRLDEGQTTYEIGSFIKLVCRGGKLLRA